MKGYHARTRDIKVVNIRNELRVRRLISVINNLYSALDREHEEAVKNREQLNMAIKYLSYQILEQNKLNQIQLRKEQVKAAIKIQAWWRGCMAKKAFPHKRVNRDQVSILFALCRKLQTQLDEVTSQINELTKGKEGKGKESRHEADQANSEVQGQFYDLLGQVDSSRDNGEADHTETHTYSPTIQHSEANLGPSTVRPLVEEHDEIRELKSSEDNIPFPVELESEGKFVSTEISVPLDPKMYKVAPSADKLDHEGFGMALSNSDQTEPGVNTETSSTDLEEDITASSAVAEKEEKASLIPNTERIENDNEELLEGPLDLELERGSNFSGDEGDFQGESRFFPSPGQDEPHYETVASECNVQMDQLEEKTALCVGPLASIAKSQESELTEKVPNWEAHAEKTLQLGIPEIIVSSPVRTDDEGSDEGDTSDIQGEVKRNKKERRDTADNHSHADSSWKFSSSFQVKKFDQKPSEGDTGTKKIKDNISLQKEGDVLQKFHESNQETVRSAADSLPSVKSSSGKPGEEAAAEQTGSSVSQGSAPSLGERATSLLSQLRSEIANMKTARLSSASPNISSDDDADTTEIENTEQANLALGHANTSSVDPTSQESDTVLEKRDTSQSEPVSAVTYRLPLFEDVDSTCTSLSLDDFLSDPALEKAVESPVSETGGKLKGTDE